MSVECIWRGENFVNLHDSFSDSLFPGRSLKIQYFFRTQCD